MLLDLDVFNKHMVSFNSSSKTWGLSLGDIIILLFPTIVGAYWGMCPLQPITQKQINIFDGL